MSGTSGSDSIQNGGYWNVSDHRGGRRVTINAGAGNDFVFNNGRFVTIAGGKGDDLIYLSNDSEGNVIQYNDGDGDDTVEGFSASTTL